MFARKILDFLLMLINETSGAQERVAWNGTFSTIPKQEGRYPPLV